ncbi:hypothetical protein COB72_08130 [bacterium]|nr:MAG: hypothetical protein COB72_08130 [bacterium]
MADFGFCESFVQMTELTAAWKKGDTVEGYRIMSEIGRGAASVIYLVQEIKNKQIWALKHVVKNNPKEQRFLDQTEAEYKIASNLDHDSVRKIPRIIKRGSLLKTNELYLVMELVDGISLHEEQPDDLATTVDIFRQTASALAHMHDRGYVHADMKPHNVIVGVDLAQNYTAKLIDLGQSCKSGTIKKRIQGTPDYIAPEQVHRREITAKTDVYNFGATMYWVLTGKNIPTAMGVGGDSLTGSRDDSLIAKATPVIEINPLVPDRLNDLVMQCIEVDPSNRVEDMDIVADKLDLILGILRADPIQAD